MGLFSKFSNSLKKTAGGIEDALRGLAGFPNGRVPEDVLEELEDALILADVGVDIAADATNMLRAERFKDGDDVTAVKEKLAAYLAGFFAKTLHDSSEKVAHASQPYVTLVVGVNGAGKTTFLGKLSQVFRTQGKRSLLAAGDTFRAGAAQQLKVWAERAKTEVILPQKEGQDPAGFLYGAYENAQKMGVDMLLCDTAGRLQNRQDLMDELGKIYRVFQNKNNELPHEVLLVLDATVGQNAVQQVKLFQDMLPISGLVINKLDGSAKAGVLVALARQFQLPILWVGTGEKLDDLQPFDAQAFARALVGLEG